MGTAVKEKPIMFWCAFGIMLICGCRSRGKAAPKSMEEAQPSAEIQTLAEPPSVLVPMREIDGEYRKYTGIVRRERVSDTEQDVTFSTKDGDPETVRLIVGSTIGYGEGGKHKYVVTNDDLTPQ